MEQYKFSQLITQFEFVVGVMKVIENKSMEAFTCAVMDYQKMKNTLISKSSVRLILDSTEYAISIKKNELPSTLDAMIENTEIETEMLETVSDWEKQLSDNIIKKLIIKHYLSKK